MLLRSCLTHSVAPTRSATAGHHGVASKERSELAVDETLLAELKTTKAAIDELQQKLKTLVASLREQGASAQEIAEALRG